VKFSTKIRRLPWIAAFWLVASIMIPAWTISDVPMTFLLVAPGLIAVILLVVGVCWITLPVYGAIQARRALKGKRYAAASLWSALPIAALLLVLWGREASVFLRFEMEKPAYERIIADAQSGHCSPRSWGSWGFRVVQGECRQPLIIVFRWGGALSNWQGIVYDADDQIDKPVGQRDAVWKATEAGTLLSCSDAYMALGGHYYRAGGDFARYADDCQ
jgi:hypothetical protein